MPITHEEARNFQPARSFDWEVLFEKDSGINEAFLKVNQDRLNNLIEKYRLNPFNLFFPASEIDEGLFDIQSQSFETPDGIINIPKNRAETNLSINFYDDFRFVLETFFEDWANEIKPFDGSVLPLEECVKKIRVNKLVPLPDLTNRGLKTIIKTNYYYIYPDGTFNASRNQNSSLQTYTMNFKIVGKL